MKKSAMLSHPGRLLEDHVLGVASIMEKEIQNVAPVIDTRGLFGFELEKLIQCVRLVGLLHDLGKATPWFQKKINRRSLAGEELELAKHALLGSVIVFQAIEHMFPKKDLAPLCYAVVRRHHSYGHNLDNEFSLSTDQQEVLLRQWDNLDGKFRNFIEEKLGSAFMDLDMELLLKLFKRTRSRFVLQPEVTNPSEVGIAQFLLHNYLFSLLTYADRTDVLFRDYPQPPRSELPENLVDRWRTVNGFDKPESTMNKLRDNLYTVVNRSVEKVELNRIYTIPAPTGLGKTASLLSAGLKLRRRIAQKSGYSPRIIYALPFLSIIDQNMEVAREILSGLYPEEVPTSLLSAQHHLSELEFKDEETAYEPQQAELLLNSWSSEVIFTTFVSLFESLVTNRRTTQFFRVPGSILLLDEIQALPRKYWELISAVFEHLVRFGGCLPVVGTATLPPIFPQELVTSLCASHEWHLNRFGFINEKALPLEEFINQSKAVVELAKKQNLRVMIVLNTIKAAEEVYDGLTEFGPYFLSTHVPPVERMARIKQIKSRSGFVILVTTQLVEAGVDLDFDKVLRDMGPLDSLVQVAGRTNRSWLKDKGSVNIYEILDKGVKPYWKYVYDPLLVTATKEIFDGRQLGEEPDLYRALSDYFASLKLRGSPDESNQILKAIDRLEFEKAGEFTLIDERGRLISVFLELDEEAALIWKLYLEFFDTAGDKYEQLNFLHTLRRKLQPFVVNYRIPRYSRENLPPEVYGLHYVSRKELDQYYHIQKGFHTGTGNGVIL